MLLPQVTPDLNHAGSSLAATHQHQHPSESPLTSPRIPPILRLPPEIFSYFLDHVPPSLLQRTALALHRVFPDSRIAEEYLWRYVTVRKGEQLVPLWHAARRRRDRIRENNVKGGGRVRGLVVESWRGDADILNNALRCLPDIPVLVLNMGTNFAPEHLSEMFETHRPTMERLELRFRPYVEQASYYQFLKGSYFDTAIEMLTHKWPESPQFTKIAIVQDIPPRTKHSMRFSFPNAGSILASAETSTAATSTAPSAVASAATSSQTSPSLGATQLADDVAAVDIGSDSEREELPEEPPVEPRGYSGHGPFPYLGDKLAFARPKTFAQPIVFFDIRCIARFGASPSARHLTHIRLRVPSRDVVSVLISSPGRHLFPSLRYLDISTTNVRLDAILSTLLRQYQHLEHLVMDRVNLFGFQGKDKGAELCKVLGGMIPSAGLARGKERERMIVLWDVGERTRIAQAQAEAAHRARLGGASSTGNGLESPLEQANRLAREAAEERNRQVELARARRGHRSAAISGFSMRTSTRRSSVSTTNGPSTAALAAAGITLSPTDRLYLVLPPLPTLRTVCIGGEARLTPLGIREWNAEFMSGWRESLANVAGWAAHVGERYERAKRKAEEWTMNELKRSNPDQSTVGSNNKGKSKSSTLTTLPRPPLDIRLYRYPFPTESQPHPYPDPSDPNPISGLIQLEPIGREYLDAYKSSQAELDMYIADNSNPPPCVLCTVPDCEGPPRRGDEGGKVDGRGGMDGVHQEGCGHAVGRGIWGWEGM